MNKKTDIVEILEGREYKLCIMCWGLYTKDWNEILMTNVRKEVMELKGDYEIIQGVCYQEDCINQLEKYCGV